MPSTAAARAGSDAGPSFSPLYRQIKQLLTEGLHRGDWKPGEMIPSETELAARFRVSQGTVRKAIDELATENLLVRRQGRGTFVATHAEERTQYRFLRLVPDTAEASQPPARGGLRRRFLDCRRMRAPAEIARALQLPRGETAVQVRRLLLDGAADAPESTWRPVVLDDIWLPTSLFKGLTAERLATYRGPMYALFETAFGVRMVRAEEKIRAVAAGPDEAAALQLPPGTPLLEVDRLSYTYGDRPVEWRRGLYHTAAHHYRNELG